MTHEEEISELRSQLGKAKAENWELQAELDFVAGKLLDLLEPTLTREEVIMEIQELERRLNDPGESDEPESEGTKEGEQ